MERYFLKFVKKDGSLCARPHNFETMCEAVEFAVAKMDAEVWQGWALYEVPDHWNWNITPPEQYLQIMFCTDNWMKLI